ncbi:hypothetical protein JCM24511_04272 [Saitozyma sp. JCM 24511]|nr:hypothetical protein JCM24511_04272 [Saitozyma sp. JCM 24511]
MHPRLPSLFFRTAPTDLVLVGICSDLVPLANANEITEAEIPSVTSLDVEDKKMYQADYKAKAAELVHSLTSGEEAGGKSVGRAFVASRLTSSDLQLKQGEVEDLETKIDTLSLVRATSVTSHLIEMHRYDHNFPRAALDRMEEFINNSDVLPNPDKHAELIREVKLECILSLENSPYLEVRANVHPTDDPTMPRFTFRIWVIGLNPGNFNQKEHMLITIMCSVSFSAPYTNYIVPAQAMPAFFNEKFAYNRGYQYLNTLGTNFVGYGLAGLTRKFLVYPSVAIWPATLNMLGLIKAFHTETNEPVKGPFGRIYRASREKAFLVLFLAMFCYYFFPGFIFQALSVFSWITWIAPNNADLDTVCGFFGGLGLNPWPTFDWNNLTVWLNPLTIPTFAIMNRFIGILLGALMTLAVYYSNSWYTGYLPINGNSAYDNTGNPYIVSAILDSNNQFQDSLYQQYSQAWLSAGYIMSYIWYFALYSATFTFVIIFQGRNLLVGARSMIRAAKKHLGRPVAGIDDADELSEDIHYRLMKQNYKEVPEWQYLIVLLISIVIGMVGVGIYPTNTSPVVLIFGIIMPLIVIIPCGLIQAITGMPVPLNVLAEFIGGALTEGNANALMYFKTYGYIAVYQALYFANDLKLVHYIKIPPRHTFYAQLWATLMYCMVSASIFNFAMGFPDACMADAAFRFTCPNQRTFFTAAIFWGTLSPKRLFGPDKRYNLMLLGFPLGFFLVIAYWILVKKFPRSERLRQMHPIMIAAGPSTWGSPYNMSYFIGNVYVTWLSFQYVRKHYLVFWAKYNYVLAAAFPAGIAISAVVIFALEIPGGGLAINWWGNNIEAVGCEGNGGCPRLTTLPEVGYFGGDPGTFT